MPKKKKKIDNNKQLSLLDVLRQAQGLRPADRTEGSVNIGERLRLSLIDGIKQSNMSRWEIAGVMSHLLGREVSKYTLDSWTAESKDNHRPPADAVPAFCLAVNYMEPLRILTDPAGLFTLPGPDALRAEIRKLDEQRLDIMAEKRKREIFLKEMEGKYGGNNDL
jgi:hypothetical protein